MSLITSHVLDTRLGRPAVGVAVELERQDAAGAWRSLASGRTNADGRVVDLLPGGDLAPGRYRLTFDVDGYFSAQQVEHFFLKVTIEFAVAGADEHYHVPLLLSPFGYSAYRGS